MASYPLDDIKKVLRALIISCPHGLTVEQLDRDFSEMEGTKIPFYDYGFNSLESFLQSIPDTLLVNGRGRNAPVYGVSSDKTKHIEELVSKQKNIKSSRKIIVPKTNNGQGSSSIH